jgi:hypothetical protein
LLALTRALWWSRSIPGQLECPWPIFRTLFLSTQGSRFHGRVNSTRVWSVSGLCHRRRRTGLNQRNGPLHLARDCAMPVTPRVQAFPGRVTRIPIWHRHWPSQDSPSSRPPRPRFRSRILKRSLAPGPCKAFAPGQPPGPFTPGRGQRPSPDESSRDPRDSTGSIPHSHTQPESEGPGQPREIPGPCMECPARVGPMSDPSCTWWQLNPSASAQQLEFDHPIPSPGLCTSRPDSDALERTVRPASPRLTHQRFAFGHPCPGPDVWSLLPCQACLPDLHI